MSIVDTSESNCYGKWKRTGTVFLFLIKLYDCNLKVDVDDIIEAADLFMDSKKSASLFKENDPDSKFIV